MKPFICLVVLSFLSGTGILSADERIAEGLLEDHLLQGAWEEVNPDEPGLEFKQIFKDEEGKLRFVLRTDIMDEDLGSGYIILEGGTISFAPIPETAEANHPTMDEWIFPKNGSLWKNTTTFSYYEYMKLEPKGMTFWNFNRPIKSGDRITYNGVPIVVIKKSGTTNDGVKVRIGPATSQKPVDLSKYGSFFQRGYKAGQTFINSGENRRMVGLLVPSRPASRHAELPGCRREVGVRRVYRSRGLSRPDASS